MQEKSFTVFQLTAKIFPTSFINLSKAKLQKFPYTYEKTQ